jgi:DNA-directed RNA polymerase specialized sigma24 family protein
VRELLAQVQEPYRAALILFYLDDNSYKEIADILEVPMGTVRSRIARGLRQLQQSFSKANGAHAGRHLVPLVQGESRASSQVID